MSLQATEERVATRKQENIPPTATDLPKRFDRLINACDGESAIRVLRNTPELIEEIVLEGDVDGTHYYLVRCQTRQPSAPQVSLSPRELMIARLVVKGLPNKSIGDVLEISPWTVATHLRRIFTKLGVASRAAMVARLLEENIL